MVDNPFRVPTAEEKALRDKKLKDRKKALADAEEQAMKCLNSKEFVKYKDKYTKLRELAIEALIEYEEPDPMKYALGVRTAITKIHQLKLLLRDVIVDAKARKE